MKSDKTLPTEKIVGVAHPRLVFLRILGKWIETNNIKKPAYL